ncbi:hypothetical protein KO507_10385 [Gilvimarinus agarilyticus]|uniref:Uncharacterized protein n=1 Tax=Reichenbachiella agariperforans TaxID=156994 RepID=A0A1M6R5I2_REIAG|nr:hypothetical protein [Reichenbachiella agariperforans]MBU2886169.1 hypothetical protein [Gilvimarinus agarilyticus]MBU2912823.1 hypothetical protein [Reichenbachiella agariperforans]SHK27745.1 hypothetical protein SAMN04488028_10447 [Reichenbachiella agariperforans]
MKNILYIYIAVAFLSSCVNEREVAPIMDPTTKPLVTISTDDDLTSVSEGDVFTFNVMTSKLMKENIAFSYKESEGNASVEGMDFDVSSGVLAPYAFETTFTLEIPMDNFPQETTKLAIEIGSYELADTWQFSPESEPYMVDVDVKNVNDPDALTIGVIWDDPEHVTDFDVLVEAEDQGSWSNQGATGANPEIDTSIRSDYGDDTDDTYLVGLDPYDVPDGDISFKVHVGYPNGDVEIFEGTFNKADLSTYIADDFTAFGSTMYRILRVVQTGNTYDVTFTF